MKTHRNLSRFTDFTLVVILLVGLLYTGPALAATVTVSATENNGPVSVTANATYSDSQKHELTVYLDDVTIASARGQGSASCSTIIDGAVLSNGSHIVRAETSDTQGSAVDTDTFTIQNPVSLTPNSLTIPTEALDVTGSAQFLARKDGVSGTGTIEIRHKAATSSTWPSYVDRAKGYATPSVSFTCQDMVGYYEGGLFDVATWPNGGHDFKVEAIGANGARLDPSYLSTTIQNPIALDAQTNPNPTGPLDVTGSAQFIARRTQGQTTGSIEIRYKHSTASSWPSVALRQNTYITPSVSFTCQDMGGYYAAGLIDIGTWANGVWDIKVDAIGANLEHFTPKLLTTTIQNPISLDFNVPDLPTGPVDVTGSAQFISRVDATRDTGRIEIRWKLSTASSWPSVALRQNTYKVPFVSFTCQDMGGYYAAGLIDIGTWANGVWDIKVDAIAANNERLIQTKTITVDNTPKVTASCPRYVSGDFDIMGSAVFTETLSGNKGTLYIKIDSQSTSGALTKTYAMGDSAGFSYSEMAGQMLNADTLGHGEHVAYIIAQAKNGVWSDWLAVPFTTGPPEADGSGNLKIITQ